MILTGIAFKPADRQPIPRPVKVELSLRNKKVCMLCGRKEISEKLYGKLYKLDDIVIHHYCIVSGFNKILTYY